MKRNRPLGSWRRTVEEEKKMGWEDLDQTWQARPRPRWLEKMCGRLVPQLVLGLSDNQFSHQPEGFSSYPSYSLCAVNVCLVM